MLKLIIEDDEGRKTVVPFVRDEITIGRQEGNTIRLTERNVSRRHARLLRANGSVVVEDLGSYNGIRVNGEKVVGRASIHDGDLIQIGDYDLAIQKEAQAQPPAPPPAQAGSARPPPLNGGKNGSAATVDEPETEASSPVYEADQVEDTSPTSSDSELARRQSTSIIRVDQIEGNRARKVAELDPEEAPRLVVVNSEFAGREFACIRTELRIGRTDDNDISLDHRSLSRTHAKLVREDSGEWRVVDMQSANGLMVNGEHYAQATLNHLDVIELGHVKLRFVAAGEAYSYSASAEERAERRQASGGGGKAAAAASKTPMLAAVGGGVVLVLAIGGYFAFRGGPDVPPGPGPMITDPQPIAVAQPPAPVPAVTPDPPAPVEPPKPAAVDNGPKARRLLASFPDVLGRGELDRARKLLDEVRALDGLPKDVSAEVDELADQLAAEQQVPRRLDLAEKAIAAGRLEQAQQFLEDTRSTAAFSGRHEKLAGLLAQKQEAAAQAAVTKVVAVAPPKPVVERSVQPKDPPKPSNADEARKLIDEGTALLGKKQNKEARAVFTRCLELDPTHGKCHLLLGATYARLGEMEQGAKHYDMFLKLAPNAPEAPKVRTLLDQYKQSKKGN